MDHAPYDLHATYPEDGANITFFEGHMRGRVWCEIERVGPLETLCTGERSTLRHSLRIVSLPNAGAAEPDALRRELEARAGGLS